MATDGLHDPADAGSQSPHGESAVPYKSNSGVGAIPAPAGSDGLAGAEAGAGAGASASAGAGKAAEPEVAVAVVAPDGGAAVDGARGSGGAAAASGADTPSRAIQMPEDPTWHEAYCNKGNISNLVTFVIMVVGLVWVLLEPSDADGAKTASRDVGDYVLALGLFGFAGGTTNWLAVKMLFDRIPYIYGSGVIPARFKEIRETVKDTIMATFFDSAYLKTYLTSRAKTFLSDLQLEEKMAEELAKPEIDALIQEKLNAAIAKGDAAGQMLMMASGFVGGPAGMVPVMKPLVSEFGKELGRMFVTKFDPEHMMDIPKIRREIDQLMTEKLKLLTPQIVKRLMESVVRKHLGWLIVWGNVFGGLIGVIAHGVGYGQG